MRTIYLLLSILLIAAPLSAQDEVPIDGKVHPPDQQYKLLDNSTLTYIIEGLPDTALLPVLERKLNSPYNYVGENDDGRFIGTYQANEEIALIITTEEGALAAEDYDGALRAARDLVEQFPEFHPGMVAVGDCFFLKKEYDSAAVWLNKAIELNPYGYQARWFLGDALWELHDTTGAIRQLARAHILNIYKREIDVSLFDKRLQTGYNPPKWDFPLNYRLNKSGDTVTIRVDSLSVGYAMTKALWKYEPGYKEQMIANMEGGEIEALLVEELEAIMMLMVDAPRFPRLARIVNDGYAREFALYEIVLLHRPDVAYFLTDEGIDRLVEYLLKYR
jgi:tetratricopeptide (TPR) repeat protein